MSIIVATGEVGGNGLTWDKRFAVVENARDGLMALESVQNHAEVDWDAIFDGLPDFKFLSSTDYWPPFYNPNVLEEVSGFIVVDQSFEEEDEDDDDDDIAGMSFARIEIHIHENDVDEMLQDFQRLWENLSAYDPIKPML
jgi:hypothetical protein